MIKKLTIDNFRSIDHLEFFEPKRINVIIGEEGTGKSTLLEALGLVSFSGVYKLIEENEEKFHLDQLQNFSLQQFVKFSYLHAGDLFHKFNEIEEKKNYAQVEVHSGGLRINVRLENYQDDYTGYNVKSIFNNYEEQRRIRYYNFNSIPLVNCNFSEYLLPGRGINFWNLVENDVDIIEKIKDDLDAYGIKFGFVASECDASKDRIPSIKPAGSNNWILLSNLSDALQLECLYKLTQWKGAEFAALIYPNFGQGMFPSQTKSLCWNMSMNMEKTQFFITTYDAIVAEWLLERTSKGEIGLYATYMEKGKTKLYEFTEDQISDLMSYSMMFNFPRYLPNYVF